ncbi:MAG: LysR family transcriptional regulator [Ilumatobacteraceae bacterium]
MTLGDVDLNLLLPLDALLTERNVTRAGRAVGMSQPTMSRALARLRRTLDDPLLVRVGREMQLTPRAAHLGPEVKDLLRRAERTLHHSPVFHPASSEREFSVSCSDYATLVLMSAVLCRVREQAPHVRLHLLPRSDDAPGLLQRGEVDLVVEPESLMEAGCWSTEPIFTDRWRAAVWSGSPLARGRITRDRFLAAPYLTYTLGNHRVPNRADQLLEQAGIGRKATVTTDNFALVPFLLRGTDLVALVLERGITAFGDALEITALAPPVQLPRLVESMFWNPRDDHEPAHRWLRDTIRATASTI